MSDNIDIKIREDGSRVVGRNLDEIAGKAEKAESAIDKLNKSISNNARLAQAANNSATAKLYKEYADAANLAASAEKRLTEAMIAGQNAAKSNSLSITNKLLKERALEAEHAASAVTRLNSAMMGSQSAAQNTALSLTNKILQERAIAASAAALAQDKLTQSTKANTLAAQANSASITQRLIAQRQSGSSSTPYNALMNTPAVTTQAKVNDEPVKRLSTAHKNLASSVRGSSEQQQYWNKISKDGHAVARGLSGSLGTLWMTYGSLIPLLTGAALGSAFVTAAKAGSQLSYELTFVKALGDESAESIGKLRDQAMSLGTTTAYGPKDIASGYRVLAQAGLEAADSLRVMPNVLNLATAGELNMENASLAVVGTLNAFKLEMSDAARVGDLFAKAAAVSQSSVTDLTAAMKTASTTGTQYKQSVDDTMAALALLAKVNILGTSAGTAYRNMLKEIYTPTKDATKAWKQLGVETFKVVNGRRELKSFVEIMYELKAATAKYDTPSQGKIIGYLFGERGAKEAAQMLALTAKEWDDFQSKIVNSKGFSEYVANEVNGTAVNQWKIALNTLEAELIGSFQRMEPGFISLAQQFKGIFESQEFKSAVDIIVETTLVLTKKFLELVPVIYELVKAWAVLKAAQLGAGIAGMLMATATAAQNLAGGMLAASGAMGPVARGVTSLTPLIAALGGPLTIILGLLAAGAAAWLVWGRNAETASGKAIKSANERLAQLKKEKEFGAGELGEAKAELAKLQNRSELMNSGPRQPIENLKEAQKAVDLQQELVDLLEEREEAMKKLTNVVTPKIAQQPYQYNIPNGNQIWEPPQKNGNGTGASGRLSKEEDTLSKLKARLDISKQEYEVIQKYGQAQYQMNEGQTKALEIQKKIAELEATTISGLKDKGLKQRADQLSSLKEQLGVATSLGQQLKKNELLKVDSRLNEEVKLTTLIPEQRDIENKYLVFRNELLRSGVVLDEMQTSSLKQRIADQIELNKIMSARDQFIQDSDAQKQKDFSNSAEALKQASNTPGWSQNDTDKNAMGMLSGMGVDVSLFQETQNIALAQQELYYTQLQVMRDKDLLSEETYQNAKAQLEIKSQEIRMSGMTNFFTTLAGLQTSGNSTLARIGKAAAISQATMDGVVAVQKAYAGSPYPWNIAAAAAQAAISAANVAKISGLNFATGGSFVVGGSGGVDSQNVAFRASPGEKVTVATPTQVRKGDSTNKSNSSSSDNRPAVIHVHLPAGSTEETRRAAGQGAREGLAILNSAARYK